MSHKDHSNNQTKTNSTHKLNAKTAISPNESQSKILLADYAPFK